MTRENQSQLLAEFYAQKKNVMKLKSEDYANEDILSNFKTAGANCGISAEQQCLSLIATKVARLGNLLSGKTPNNESVSDSILDLSNYTDLLYCLVNEQITDIVNPFRGISRKSIVELSKKKEHAKSNPLTLEECIEPKPQTKRWENVKPKGIIQALKEKESYEPKVGDRFKGSFGDVWEITRVEKLYCSLLNDEQGDINIIDLSHYQLQAHIKSGVLKKIN